MYKVGDKVIVIYEDWLYCNQEYRNKVFTVVEDRGIQYDGTLYFHLYKIRYKDFEIRCSTSSNFNPLKKLSTLLSEYLKSLKAY